MFRTYNTFLLIIEKMLSVISLRVEFSRGEASLQLERMFKSDGVQGMMKGNHYYSTDISFAVSWYPRETLQTIGNPVE